MPIHSRTSPTALDSKEPISLIFFGSFLAYSSLVLETLHAASKFHIIAVITTPPQPAGRNQVLTKTDVHLTAERLGLPIVTPDKLTAESLANLQATFSRPQILVTSGYGKLLPPAWLTYPSLAALNLHFSLLPRYRGANPAEWALLHGETQTGITLIEMSPEFDTGTMIAQQSTPLTASDTRETVYERLYSLGGELLRRVLPEYVAYKVNSAESADAPTTGTIPTDSIFAATGPDTTIWLPPIPQPVISPTPYAKRLQRPDGFLPWSDLMTILEGKTTSLNNVSPSLKTALSWDEPAKQLDARDVDRIVRALAGFPGLWTIVPTAKGDKRLKILTVKLQSDKLSVDKLVLEKVHLEGQQPALWNQIKNAILI